jgi:hypothetical protein
MTAFHTAWTKPFFALNPLPFFLDDWDILTTMLSALEWRRHNGGVKMITDKAGAEYYRKLGIDHIWNLGVETLLETAIDGAIKPMSFWAAGKIYALRSISAPCAMIDTDFIVWEPVNALVKKAPISVIHREKISDAIYPPKTFFAMNGAYAFPETWDWSVEPCNTAFLFINDEELKSCYTEQSINFMKNLKQSRDITAEMVFAEQRLLAMCCREKNITINAILDVEDLKKQRMFTHVWGLKSALKGSAKTNREFCANCVSRILTDFPEEKTNLENIEALWPYLHIQEQGHWS